MSTFHLFTGMGLGILLGLVLAVSYCRWAERRYLRKLWSYDLPSDDASSVYHPRRKPLDDGGRWVRAPEHDQHIPGPGEG